MQLHLTRSVKILAMINLAAFVIQKGADQFFGAHVLSWFALIPHVFFQEHRFWQIITYSFFHMDVGQLFFNLLTLILIGAELEMIWGSRKFLRYYFFCATLPAILYVLVLECFPQALGLNAPFMGSSAAIYGLLMAYGILFSERTLLFMMLFPMKAKHFVWALAAMILLSSLFTSGNGTASLMELTGMGFGLIYLWAQTYFLLRQKASLTNFNSGGRPRKKKLRNSKHLKLIVNNPKTLDILDPSDDGGDSNSSPPKTWH